MSINKKEKAKLHQTRDMLKQLLLDALLSLTDEIKESEELEDFITRLCMSLKANEEELKNATKDKACAIEDC